MEEFKERAVSFQIWLAHEMKFIEPPEYLHIVLGKFYFSHIKQG